MSLNNYRKKLRNIEKKILNIVLNRENSRKCDIIYIIKKTNNIDIVLLLNKILINFYTCDITLVNLISNRIMLGKEIAISKYDNTFNNIDDNTIYKKITNSIIEKKIIEDIYKLDIMKKYINIMLFIMKEILIPFTKRIQVKTINLLNFNKFSLI
jgi:chorismate mutase